MNVTVYARNDSLSLVGQFDDLASLTAVALHQGTGSWIVTAPLDSRTTRIADELFPAASLTHVHAGIEVWVDNWRFLSGPLEHFRRDTTGGYITLSGVTDEFWIRERMVSPDPTDSTFPSFAVAYDVRTGLASTVMGQYVNFNAGPLALAPRRVPGLIVGADPAAGGTVTGRGRWHINLEDLLRSLAVSSGADLGWRVTPNDAGGLIWTCTVPADLTDDVVFVSSGPAPLPAVDVVVDRRRRTVSSVIVGGSGEEELRVFRNVTTAGPVRERFRDRRDTDDVAILDQSGNEALAENAGSATVTVDVSRSPFVLGTDYTLGDRVMVDTPQGDVAGIVRSIVLQVDNNGVVLRPVIGPPGVSDPQQFSTAESFDRRISQLEGV